MANISRIFILPCLFFYWPLAAQQPLQHRDPEIAEMVRKVSAENLENTVRKLAGFGTRHSLSETQSDTRGIGAARRWVKSQFDHYAEASGGRLTASLDAFTVEADGRRVLQTVEMKNVMAVLQGSDPADDRVLIISGHLDSRASDVMDSESPAPGANDDASGVALVMEIARIMSQRRFPCDIIFVAVSGEEQGLYGSEHLADKAKEEGWNIVAMLNNDIVGNSTSSGTNIRDNGTVRVFSEATPANETEEMQRIRRYTGSENDGRCRQLARYIKEVGEDYVDQFEVKLIFRNDRYLRGGDHIPFVNHGFTAVRFSEMHENYAHQHQDVRIEEGKQYGDLPEFMDFGYLKKVTGINLAVLASLALAPEAPRHAGIDVSELSNFTTLTWDPPEGAQPYAYYVLMRETYQPFWQRKIFVRGNTVTLPYSKDNYLFAVQSVDEEGHTSLPRFPVPLR